MRWLSWSSWAAVAAALNIRAAPGLRAARLANRPLRAPHIIPAAAGVDVPVPTLLGLRFALEGGRGRTSVPVRSSILAATLAIVVVVGSLTFGSSLNTLIGTPRLYGWNWSAMLESDAGYGNVPQTQAARLLDNNHSVTGWSGIDFDSLLFDGQAVPVIAGQHAGPNRVRPSCPATKSMHPIRSSWDPKPCPTCTSGWATPSGCPAAPSRPCCTSWAWPPCPPSGIGFGLHLSIGSGAYVDQSLIPPTVPALLGLSDPGPNAILVRFAPSVSAATAQHSLAAMVKSLNRLESGSAGILSFTDIRPAEITDYQAMGAAPADPGHRAVRWCRGAPSPWPFSPLSDGEGGTWPSSRRSASPAANSSPWWPGSRR